MFTTFYSHYTVARLERRDRGSAALELCTPWPAGGGAWLAGRAPLDGRRAAPCELRTAMPELGTARGTGALAGVP